MNRVKRQELAKVAYLYYIEGWSQDQISKHLGIYRTTISRMLTQAKKDGIVQIKIQDFNPEILKLETLFQERYGLDHIEIVQSHPEDSETEKEEQLSKVAAQWIRKNIQDGDTIGLAWGASIGKSISYIEPKYLENSTFVPIVGGPSRSNSRYHINTLVYDMAKKFHGKSIFVNATVVQESEELAKGIFNSKYFQELKENWKHLDMVILGVGGALSYKKSQWRDLIDQNDYKELKLGEAVGDCCCRFFNQDGKILKGGVDNRTIGLSLDQLSTIPKTVAIARGNAKVRAIRALIKRSYINTLITDQDTLMGILKLDNIQMEQSN
ncbi:sugar-binding transcriptional regulator [Streptococcus gallolyticus]|nr:sugar-binding transcriptional regulator [Streptococcus gallolyticus]MBY5041557.1 sugar-binding transcriptional regulator [Streptococcus gallolyticus]